MALVDIIDFDFDSESFDFSLSQCDDASSSSIDGTDKDSPGSTGEVEKPKKKRIRIKKTFSTKPTRLVVKDDIRRSYVFMCMNILNSLDFPLMYGFLNTFLIPDASYCEDHFGMSVSVSGILQVAMLCAKTMVLHPDGVFRIRECNVDYNTGRIFSRVEMSVTKMYDDDSFKEVLEEEAKNLMQPLAKRPCVTDDSVPTIKQLMSDADVFASKIVRKSIPELTITLGTFTIHCDADKRITAFDIYCNQLVR